MIISNIIRDLFGDLQSFKFSTTVVGDRAIVPSFPYPWPSLCEIILLQYFFPVYSVLYCCLHFKNSIKIDLLVFTLQKNLFEHRRFGSILPYKFNISINSWLWNNRAQFFSASYIDTALHSTIQMNSVEFLFFLKLRNRSKWPKFNKLLELCSQQGK